MSERELHRAVARVTGEFVETIQRLGFRLEGDELRDEPGPRIFDWDDHEPAYLRDVVSEDDWPGRIDSVPSYDDDLDEELSCAAA